MDISIFPLQNLESAKFNQKHFCTTCFYNKRQDIDYQ